MSNRRVKALDYDEDDLDDYDEEYDEVDDGQEELSSEDKELLRLGTVEVRKVLGPAYQQVSESEIHDALWNFYYDVPKTVNQIKGNTSKIQLRCPRRLTKIQANISPNRPLNLHSLVSTISFTLPPDSFQRFALI